MEKHPTNKNGYFKSGDQNISDYISGKEMWKDGVIISRVGKPTYLIQGPNWIHKRHVNQLKHRFIKEENVLTHLSMEILCDTFNLPKPQVIKPQRVSKRKRNPKKILDVDLEIRKYLF